MSTFPLASLSVQVSILLTGEGRRTRSEWLQMSQRRYKPDTTDQYRVLKENRQKPWFLYLAKISVKKNKGKVKIFLEKQKLRKCVSSSPMLREVLKVAFNLNENATRWKLGSIENGKVLETVNKWIIWKAFCYLLTSLLKR